MKIPRNAWTLGGILALGVAAYLYLVFLPLGRRIEEVHQEAEQKLELVTGAAPLAPALFDTEQQLASAQRYVREWQEAGSVTKDPSSLHAQIHELARSSGVSATRFNPDRVLDHQWLREIPLTMGVRGPYAQVHEFLARLEAMSTTISVESLQMEPAGENRGDVNCEISMVVFADNLADSD